MDAIVNLGRGTIISLAAAAAFADERGYRLRIQTGTDRHGPWVKWDCGQGWTPPMYSQEVTF